MGDKTIKTVLSAVRMLVIVAGALLCIMITSKSGADAVSYTHLRAHET